MSVIKPARMSIESIEALMRRSESYRDYESRLGEIGLGLRTSWASVRFSAAELEKLEAIQNPLRIFALVEAHCPDVVANLPIMAQLVERNASLSLFVLDRSDHPEFAATYPGPTIAHSKIPTYVVIDANHRELGVLLERPPAITEILRPRIDRMYAAISARFPGIDRTLLPAEDLAAVAAELLPNADSDRAALGDVERKGIVEWILTAASR